jgi:hypothetical protein
MKTPDKKHIAAKSALPAYTLIRSDRHSMEIKVQPITGEIILRIPRRSTQKTAEDFLRRNLPQVLSAVERAKAIVPDRMHTALSDEEIRFGPLLMQRMTPLLREYITWRTSVLGERLSGLLSAREPDLPAIAAIRSELSFYQARLEE